LAISTINRDEIKFLSEIMWAVTRFAGSNSFKLPNPYLKKLFFSYSFISNMPVM